MPDKYGNSSDDLGLRPPKEGSDQELFSARKNSVHLEVVRTSPSKVEIRMFAPWAGLNISLADFLVDDLVVALLSRKSPGLIERYLRQTEQCRKRTLEQATTALFQGLA